jgi:flagellar basal-body rod protein FlgB
MMQSGAQTGLFALAENRLAWLDARQRVLAQNVANADTPGYRARDVTPFGDMLAVPGIGMAQTSPLHLASQSQPLAGAPARAAERAPDGNAVVLEDQMTRIADDETAQALTGNIWHSYMGMFMTALGHAG